MEMPKCSQTRIVGMITNTRFIPTFFLETLLLERYGVGGAPCMLLPIFPSLKVRKKA